MTTRKLADGARRHYGSMPCKKPSRAYIDRKSATMAKAIERERKKEAVKNG